MTSEEKAEAAKYLNYAAICYQEKITNLRNFFNVHDFEDPNVRIMIAVLEGKAITARGLAKLVVES